MSWQTCRDLLGQSLATTCRCVSTTRKRAPRAVRALVHDPGEHSAPAAFVTTALVSARDATRRGSHRHGPIRVAGSDEVSPSRYRQVVAPVALGFEFTGPAATAQQSRRCADLKGPDVSTVANLHEASANAGRAATLLREVGAQPAKEFSTTRPNRSVQSGDGAHATMLPSGRAADDEDRTPVALHVTRIALGAEVEDLMSLRIASSTASKLRICAQTTIDPVFLVVQLCSSASTSPRSCPSGRGRHRLVSRLVTIHFAGEGSANSGLVDVAAQRAATNVNGSRSR